MQQSLMMIMSWAQGCSVFPSLQRGNLRLSYLIAIISLFKHSKVMA